VPLRCIAVTGFAAVVSLSLSTLSAKSQSPFVVAIETSVSGGARPTIRGTTNLPDGTHLWVDLRKPYLPNAKERLAVGLPAWAGGSRAETTENAVFVISNAL
jgi:hypothetical protein